ncbi:MAG: acyl-[acyl-carrier-protein]--UDP-N-acetylglucosamine O-acyltransferase [Verrucomicrobia bacterium]|nr:MAG: acyl-[acyl-carrier-protein]--UDP-N-acetylglucosamine O-acyltransferase [Verrucomicrobiota bacterium]
MTEIHSTAIVDPSALIGDDCKIGPYCVVGPHVELGEGCILDGHVMVQGPSIIGKQNKFHPFSSIGGRSQDLKYEGEPTRLIIGNDNVFREFVTINRSTRPGFQTVIGNWGNFLAYSHIAHDCHVGDYVIFSNNGTLAGHVTVEDYVIIGGLTAVHQFCRIGQHALTGGCSKIVQDVPPFMIADGNPAEARGINTIGLKRRGFQESEISALKDAHRILYRSCLNVRPALKKIREEIPLIAPIDAFLAFVESSNRGIVG